MASLGEYISLVEGRGIFYAKTKTRWARSGDGDDGWVVSESFALIFSDQGEQVPPAPGSEKEQSGCKGEKSKDFSVSSECRGGDTFSSQPTTT